MKLVLNFKNPLNFHLVHLSLRDETGSAATAERFFAAAATRGIKLVS
jgi:hypothetical protein